MAGLVLLALLTMATALIAEAWYDSLTYDETLYVRAGRCALVDRKIDRMPLNPAGYQLLAGAGEMLQQQSWPMQCTFGYTDGLQAFFPADPSLLRRLTLAARLPFVGLSLLLAMTVFLWARALYGNAAGLLALGLVALEPNLIGHGHLATGDVSVTLGLVGCLAAHWAWTTSGRRSWLLLAGLALGWALLSKVSSLSIVGVLVVVELLQAEGSIWRRLRTALRPLVTVGLVAWATVCLVYLPFQALHSPRIWPGLPLSWLAPPSWFLGLWVQAGLVHRGQISYLNGHVITGAGPWYFYLEVLGLKSTIGFLGIAALTAAVQLWRGLWRQSLHIWLALIVIVGSPTLSGLDVGVRYVIAFYPLMAILAGSLVTSPREPRVVIAAIAMTAASLASSLAHAPLHLAYFNELAGNRPERYLSDSNLDWGQDAWRLRDWWQENGRPPLALAYFGAIPASAYGIEGQEVFPDRQEVHGLVAVSIIRLTEFGDVNTAPNFDAPYSDLSRREPVARIGSSIEIFNLDSTRRAKNVVYHGSNLDVRRRPPGGIPP